VAGEALGFGDRPSTPEDQQKDYDRISQELVDTVGHWAQIAFVNKGLPIDAMDIVLERMRSTFSVAYAGARN
jgi:hypothetical protein